MHHTAHNAVPQTPNDPKQRAATIGAIVGDFVGSAYEFAPTKNYKFELVTPASSITDDTIMSLAIADALACIAGGIAEAYYGEYSIPADLKAKALATLPADLMGVYNRFREVYLRYNNFIACACQTLPQAK